MKPESQSNFERLKVSLSEYRAREPKARQTLDSKAKRSFAVQITQALTGGAAVIDVVSEAVVLPGPVIAEGIVDAWSLLPMVDRQKLIRWMSSVESDKRASLVTRMAQLFLAGEESIRSEAPGMLLLAPDSKEAVARIGAEFLGSDGMALDRLQIPEARYGGTTIAQRLMKAALAPKVQEFRRVRALQLVLSWITTQVEIETTESQGLIASARDAMKTLTDTTLPHMSRWLDQHQEARILLDTVGVVRSTKPEANAAESSESSKPKAAVASEVLTSAERISAATSLPAISATSTPTATESPAPPGPIPPNPETESSTTFVLQRIANLKSETSALELFVPSLKRQLSETTALKQRVVDLGTALERARTSNDESDARVDALSEECQQLQQRLQAVADDRDVVKARLSEVEAATRVLQTSVQREREQWTVDRSTLDARVNELETRVQATAERRLEELRNRIAAAVSKAMRQVPDRRSSITNDEAVVVLARFYEVLEALEENGVKVVQPR
jgi:chaperonin cofactor prefoldin